jgi:hypothetical protein
MAMAAVTRRGQRGALVRRYVAAFAVTAGPTAGVVVYLRRAAGRRERVTLYLETAPTDGIALDSTTAGPLLALAHEALRLAAE